MQFLCRILGNLVNLIVKKPVAKAVEQGDVGSKARTNGKASGPLQALDIPMQALEEAQNEAQIAFKVSPVSCEHAEESFISKRLYMQNFTMHHPPEIQVLYLFCIFRSRRRHMQP